MSRFGCWMLLLFAFVIGGFALIVKHGGIPSPSASPGLAVTPATLASATPAIPVAGIAADRLVDTWEQSRAEGTRAHHAIDIPAARGTSVVAAAGGTVEKLFESRDGGHTIYIRRADPAWIDYYAHLDGYAPDLREGVAVRRGQSIGTVGATGDADAAAPHLHYEIKRMMPGETWWQGTEIDPYPILTGKPAP